MWVVDAGSSAFRDSDARVSVRDSLASRIMSSSFGADDRGGLHEAWSNS